jgi:nickel-type superoxide dismutase maturation protease
MRSTSRLHPTQRPTVTITRRWWPVVRVRVVGASMLPTCAPGDQLLVCRWARWRAGDIVALTDPTVPSRLLVKRVAWVRAGRVWVLGDNLAASTDSRRYGAVPGHLVLGRVVYRYAPSPAAGRLPRGRRSPR